MNYICALVLWITGIYSDQIYSGFTAKKNGVTILEGHLIVYVYGALFLTTKTQNQCRCLLVDEQKKKMRYGCAQCNLSSISKNDIMIYRKCTKLEGITHNERSQAQKKYCLLFSMCGCFTDID